MIISTTASPSFLHLFESLGYFLVNATHSVRLNWVSLFDSACVCCIFLAGLSAIHFLHGMTQNALVHNTLLVLPQCLTSVCCIPQVIFCSLLLFPNIISGSLTRSEFTIIMVNFHCHKAHNMNTGCQNNDRYSRCYDWDNMMIYWSWLIITKVGEELIIASFIGFTDQFQN